MNKVRAQVDIRILIQGDEQGDFDVHVDVDRENASLDLVAKAFAYALVAQFKENGINPVFAAKVICNEVRDQLLIVYELNV